MDEETLSRENVNRRPPAPVLTVREWTRHPHLAGPTGTSVGTADHPSRKTRLRNPRQLGPVLALVSALALASPAAGQLELCTEAERFLRDTMNMQALSEPDTIDDWRTRKMVPGCRVTAAGGTTRSSADVARGFFDVLAEAGWSRTPDPYDAPNEASLRYRRFGADCLFSFYDRMSSLNTEAEFDVSDAVELEPGEHFFHFLVMCTPAAPAAIRGGP